MRENYRNSIASIKEFPQFTTMNVIDGQAGLIICASLIFCSLTIDNILNIIILLILAGISISMLSGNNGILQKATEAKTQTEIGQEKEIVSLTYNSALAKKVSDGDSTAITAGDLNTELTNQGAFAKGNNPITVTFDDSKRQYTINSNGMIEYSGIKSDNDDSNIQLSVTSTGTESRAMILKVSATVTPPTLDELQVKTEQELQNMFAQACTNFWEDEEEYTWESIVEYIYEDFGATITTASQAYEYWEEYFKEDGLTGCSNVYDFIILTYGNENFKFTCTGNEDVTGTSAEFIVTNPNPKITATTTTGDYVEKIWDEYPNSKIEKF